RRSPMERRAPAVGGGRPTGAPINRVFCVSNKGTVALAEWADDVALPTVCAIVARLPNITSTTIVLIKFRMIWISRGWRKMSRRQSARDVADVSRFRFTWDIVWRGLTDRGQATERPRVG